MIRIALIGCNNAAADYGQLASRLQGARLVAVADPSDTLAESTAETLGVSLRVAGFEDLLRDNADAFDAVVVRRPCGAPRAVVTEAARAGKHVFMEMSLLLRIPPDDDSIAACQSEGVTFMPGQATRFLPSVTEVKNCLRSGVLGTPGLLRLHHWRPPEPQQNDASAHIFQAILPDIDLANWIFDALPTEVYATGKKGTDPICRNGPEGASHKLDRSPCSGPYGYVQMHLGYPDGGMALVDHSMMLPAGSNYFSLSVAGSAGAAYADDHHNMHLLYGGGHPTALPTDRDELHHLAEMQEFVDAIETGRRPAITADDGHNAVQVIRAAGRSLPLGRTMRLIGSGYELV